MPATWDPEWIELAKHIGEAPSLPEEMGEAKRQAVNAILIQAASRLPPPPEVVSRDLQIPDGPTVRAYKPPGNEGELLPMIIFCHGGGWFAGNLDTEDRTCRMACSAVPAWVVSVDYRCNLDVKLEDEVEDIVKAFEWAFGRAEAHGVDPKKIIVWGGSAGGSLASAVVYRLVQSGKGDQVAGLVLANPLQLHPDATPENYKHLMTSYVDNAGPLPFVSGDDTLGLYKHRGIAPPNTSIELFPVAGGPDAVRGFPPTFIITSDNDASRDDGTVAEAVLKDAGVRVKRENIKGLAHYFWTFPLTKANEDFWGGLAAGFRWTLGN